MQKNNKFYILQPFHKNHKTVVSYRYHENADKIFLRHCQYVAEEKNYRHIFRKWYIYKLPNFVFNYNPTIYDFYLQKKISNADSFQIDDVIILFKGAFDKINDLLKPSTDIWNKIKEKKSYLERTAKASSTNICRICLSKLQKKKNLLTL